MTVADTKVYPHGTWQKYRYNKCRCTPCCEVTNARRRARTRRNARQQWGAVPPTKVDAAPARQHVRDLMAQGVAWKRVARLAGVSTGAVRQLLYGYPKIDQPPATWVRPDTARRLLAVNSGEVGYVDATGMRRRLQALVATGRSGSELMRRLGKDPRNFYHLVKADRVFADVDRAVRRLYDELWDVVPAAETPSQRASVSRARRYAQRQGWRLPIEWDDDAIDVPETAVAS